MVMKKEGPVPSGTGINRQQLTQGSALSLTSSGLQLLVPFPPTSFPRPRSTQTGMSASNDQEAAGMDDSANYRMHSPVRRRFSLQENGEVRKVALMTGVTGQDGSYLSEFLLEKVRDLSVL